MLKSTHKINIRCSLGDLTEMLGIQLDLKNSIDSFNPIYVNRKLYKVFKFLYPWNTKGGKLSLKNMSFTLDKTYKRNDTVIISGITRYSIYICICKLIHNDIFRDALKYYDAYRLMNYGYFDTTKNRKGEYIIKEGSPIFILSEVTIIKQGDFFFVNSHSNNGGICLNEITSQMEWNPDTRFFVLKTPLKVFFSTHDPQSKKMLLNGGPKLLTKKSKEYDTLLEEEPIYPVYRFTSSNTVTEQCTIS